MSGSASASRCSTFPICPQEGDPAFRRIHQFDEQWNCSALRMMENSFDNSHFSFVHKGTFGDIDQPKPEKYELDRDALRLRRRDDRAGEKPAAGRARHRNDRALDEAQDAQRLVHAVLPHDGHGISVGPQARHLQLARRRSTMGRSASSRSCSATIARRTARPPSSSPGTRRSSRRTGKSSNRPTPTRSST